MSLNRSVLMFRMVEFLPFDMAPSLFLKYWDNVPNAPEDVAAKVRDGHWQLN